MIIGDTYFDTKGAVQTGIDFVGASYGYGDIEQMKKEGGKVLPTLLLKFIILFNAICAHSFHIHIKYMEVLKCLFYDLKRNDLL